MLKCSGWDYEAERAARSPIKSIDIPAGDVELIVSTTQISHMQTRRIDKNHVVT